MTFSTIVRPTVFKPARETFVKTQPLSYCVIDNFVEPAIAEQLVAEFPSYTEESVWNGNYANPLEIKKTCNIWDRFPQTTYSVLQYFQSALFVSYLRYLTHEIELLVDPGLHGGGWHSHARGGILNPHMDYDAHPKIPNFQRRLNMILYLTPAWQETWGGHLGLFGNSTDAPYIEIAPLFNRAVIFITTDQYHGISRPITCPSTVSRQSLAVYYGIPLTQQNRTRRRALFAPTKDQQDDPTIQDLIERRKDVTSEHVMDWSRI